MRGNVPTRLRKLVEGQGDALVVAKAALDRLLGEDGAEPDPADNFRSLVDACAWMVLPIREFPTAPAQGALAIEVARDRPDVATLVSAVTHQPTAEAVGEERAIPARYGGGCHAALGITVLSRDYGRIRSTAERCPTGARSPNGPSCARSM